MDEMRPMREEDRERVLEIMNRERPLYQHETAEQWRDFDRMMTGKEVYERLVVGDPAIAYLAVTDNSTTIWRTEGVTRMNLYVDRAYRRKGIGRMLYNHALEFARKRTSQQLRTSFIEHSTDEPAIAFLQQRGFVEQEREKPSHLDVAAFDASRFDGVIEKAEQQGVRFLTYADVPDNEANRRKLYTLDRQIDLDMPHRGQQPYEPPAYEDWVKFMSMPGWAADGIILAELDGEWVGISQLFFQQGTNIAGTATTGVLAAYRGRGIATALKLRAIEAAKAHASPIITTENHEDNGPMLAINRKLGFVPDPPYVVYVKALTPVGDGTPEQQ